MQEFNRVRTVVKAKEVALKAKLGKEKLTPGKGVQGGGGNLFAGGQHRN